MADLILRVDQLENLRSRVPGLETDNAFAERIGLHPGQVSRVLNDESHRKFGKRFIAGVLDVFGIEFFADLFAIIPTTAALPHEDLQS
jgi:hypothetical protein